MATNPEHDTLHALASAAGVSGHWRDVDGVEQVVDNDSLRAVLAALGHPADTERQARRSLLRLTADCAGLPALMVADAGQPIIVPHDCRAAFATNADGLGLALQVSNGMPFAPETPGYYDLEIDGAATRLAVAPPHCPLPKRRQWGPSLQIPSLRGARSGPFGTFGELAEAAEAFARAGADALAINPVHALFPGNGVGFSPYSPSSRRFLNGAMADPVLAGLPALPPADGPALIDWEAAMPQRLARLRDSFAKVPDGLRQQVRAEAQADDDLLRHAVFDALDCRYRPHGAKGWQDWPACYRNPANASVARFAAKHAAEVDFHLFVQWLARTGLEAVQARAKAAGMATGLVGDLAVGVDPGGSDAWSLGEDMLRGLTIGAPPDPLGPLGQNWALTSFSPEGLRRSGYAPWIAMIRAAMAHGGGLRIDHAFGLARLWVVPAGGASSDGAYLQYPFADLVRLLTLEAHLAGAFVVAEDLGTSPDGFTGAITRHRMLGMRVLWFERAEDHGFVGRQDYETLSAAMTGTHDTATVAGWWSGTDLDWADRLARLPDDVDRAKAEEIRDWDRGLLWSTIDGGHPRPAPADTAPVVDAAIRHIADTPSLVALVPMEDLCGLTQQPNLPGTITEHPNWRRRMDAPTGEMLSPPAVQSRLQTLREARPAE